jgi:hypothetical protein
MNSYLRKKSVDGLIRNRAVTSAKLASSDIKALYACSNRPICVGETANLNVEELIEGVRKCR